MSLPISQSEKVSKSSEEISNEETCIQTFKPKKGKAAEKEPRRMYMQAFSPVKNPKRPRENQNIIFGSKNFILRFGLFYLY